MASIVLRDYQSELLQQALDAWRIHRRVLIQASTGSGKTEIAMRLILDVPGTVLFVVHRKQLVHQTSLKFTQNGIPHSFISGEYPCDLSHRVLICTIQTLHKKRCELEPMLIIEDEAHHATSKMYEMLHAKFPNAKYLGLTATPRRMNGQGLGACYDVLIQGPSTLTLIQQGHLATPEIYVPEKTAHLFDDIRSELPVSMGDYNPKAINQWFDDNSKLIYGDVIQHYRQLANGQPTLVFCPSVKSVYETVDLFNAEGIPSAGIDGSMDDIARQDVLTRFANNTIKCLMSCDLIGEGIDIGEVYAVILLRLTKSLTIFLQQIGRALRVTANKHTCIIIDHVNNCEQFGPPWIQRYWTLDGYSNRTKTDSLSGVNLRLCTKCGNYIKSNLLVCPHCGKVFKSKSKVFKTIYEDLQKITIESSQQLIEKTVQTILNKEQWKMLKTREDFVAFAKEKGWNNPEVWADKKLAEKKADDDVFFNGDELALALLYTKRKHPDPRKKAQEVLATRAERAVGGKNHVVNQVFENGSLEEVVAYVKREKPEINNPEAYAAGVMRKRLAPVFASGTAEQKAAATALLGNSGGSQDRYTKMHEFAKSGKITPRDESAPRVLTDEEADKFAKAVVKKDNKVALETGSRDQVIDIAKQMHIPEERRAAFADAVLSQRK